MRAIVTNKKRNLLRAALLGIVSLALLGAGPAGAARRKAGSPGKAPAGVVNINTATEAQLELLPGIGPAKARAVVRYRARRKFRATHDLVRVRGIGRKTYRRLRVYLTVKGPTTLTAPPPRAQKKNDR